MFYFAFTSLQIFVLSGLSSDFSKCKSLILYFFVNCAASKTCFSDAKNIIAVVCRWGGGGGGLACNNVSHFSPHMPSSNSPVPFGSGLQRFVFFPQCWLSVQPALG